MIDLLYHATIYYEIRKYIQESEPAALKYEMVIEKAKAHECNVMSVMFLSTKTIRLPMEEPTSRLPTIIHC